MSGTHSDPDETEPPKRQFSFKPTEFERANRRLDEKDSNPPIDVKALYQASTVPRPAGAKVPSAPAENEVHAILKANLATANAAGENDLELRPKRLSRRKRDYWLLMLVANAFFGGMLIVLPGIGKVFGLAGMILCNLGLTWVMWFVMDDY